VRSVGGSNRPERIDENFAGRLRSVFTLVVFSLWAMVALLPGAAEAAPETIAEYGSDAGQVSYPKGAAVDWSNGDLYITEGNNFRVSKFDSAGNFLFAVGYGVADGVTPELQTCGPQASPPTTHCFAPNFYPIGLFAQSVAVDNSAGPSQGDFYVSEGGRVLKFSSTGQLVFVVGKNVNKTKEAEAGATQAEKDFCGVASGDVCGSAESGTAPNEFSGFSMPLAVDSAGIVWVGDYERIISFNSAGSPGAEIPGAGDTKSLAVDSSGDFYVRSEFLVGVHKLEAGAGVLLYTLDAGGQPLPVTLDEDDNVYIGDATDPYRFKVYNSAGDQISQFGAGEVIGAPGEGFFGTNAIAVAGAAGRLYSASSETSEAESVVQAFPLPEPGPLPEKQHVEDLLPTTVTLAADLNPEGHETTYHFEWGTSAAYGETTPTKTLPGEDFDSEAVAAELEELIPATVYHFRLCATNSDGTICGPDTAFTTPAAVVINPQWVSDITANTATLHAELNPLGVEAEAWLEYGTEESYGQVVSLTNLGPGFDPVLRQATLTGLQAGTTYHYRFTARDTRDGNFYIVHGADSTFTTQFVGIGFQLPDARVWEMVSPSDKHGARLVGGWVNGRETPLQASADGDGLAYPSNLSTETDPQGNRILEPSMNLAHRQASGSWLSKDITTPNQAVTRLAAGEGIEYKLFNSDLSEAFVEPRSGTPLSPEATPERTPYLRENTEPPVYTPLVTTKEPYANVPADTEFGGGIDSGGHEFSTGAVKLAAASADFQHFALRSRVPLVEGAPAGETLYEWSAGQLKPVSVLPPDEGGAIVDGARIGSAPASVDGALSKDGSRVFWSVGDTALYVRFNATKAASAISGGQCTEPEKGCTARIDVKDGAATGVGPHEPIFQGASADGTVVFFTDTRQLTEDASPKGADLYRCELPPGGALSGCVTLTDISVPVEAGKSGEVQGIAAAVTEDGNKVYFVAKGVLDEAPNEFGDEATSGQPNLYLWQQGADVRFIATLANEDRTDWGENSASSAAAFAFALTATASPSGRYLGFMSQRSVTGYDNRDDSSGEVAQEVFRYDSATEQLECVSCHPTGARPHSAVPLQAGAAFVDPWGLWGGRPVAAALPEATAVASPGASLYTPRAVLDNGRVFFNAIDSLVPSDSNGQWDAYQYESTEVGDCSTSSTGASISHLGEGCVALISSGTAEDEAAFVDADETGDNAFFWTSAQLSVLDEDQEVDVYDARVGGIAATRPVNAECLGEACQPATQAPNAPTPASSAFNGAGNVKPAHKKRCGKGKRRVRRKGKAHCVSRKHKRDGGKSRGAHR